MTDKDYVAKTIDQLLIAMRTLDETGSVESQELDEAMRSMSSALTWLESYMRITKND